MLLNPNRRLLFFLAGMAIMGLLLIRLVSQWGLDQPEWGIGNAFYYLTTHQEQWGLGLVSLLAVGVAMTWNQWRGEVSFPEFRGMIPLVALLVTLGCGWSWASIFHRHLLTSDENSTDFQAQIFARNQWVATIPEESRSVEKAAAPIFVRVHESEGHWVSGYLPVYAMIRSVFVRIGAGGWCNPVLAGWSVLLMAGIARKLWPEFSSASIWSVLFLISSAQFLFNGMSGYSMPAHLALNLFWLWLVLRGGRWEWFAPWVGVLALGLHQPFMHALFVVPFLVRKLGERRWKSVVYYGIVYGLGCLVWALWWNWARPDVGAMSQSSFGWPGIQQVVVQLLSGERLLAWNSLAVSWLVLIAIFRWRKLGTVEQDLAWGCVLTFGFYAIYQWDQAHGWGYRYFHPVLGNLILLAVAGIRFLREEEGCGLERKIILLVAASFLIQIPLRVWQVRDYVRPYAETTRWIQTLPVKAVVVDHTKIWYGQNLVRNSPFLDRTPLVLHQEYLTVEQREVMKRDPGVHWVSEEEVERFGMKRIRGKK